MTERQEFLELRRSEYDRARHDSSVRQRIFDRLNQHFKKEREERARKKAERRKEEEGIEYD